MQSKKDKKPKAIKYNSKSDIMEGGVRFDDDLYLIKNILEERPDLKDRVLHFFKKNFPHISNNGNTSKKV
jgi:hypothetical protein